MVDVDFITVSYMVVTVGAWEFLIMGVILVSFFLFSFHFRI